MEINTDAIISTILGSGIAGFLARAFIGQSLSQLKEVVQKVVEINNELSAISVKLQNFEKDMDLLRNHDRKIVALETHVYAVSNKREAKAAR